MVFKSKAALKSEPPQMTGEPETANSSKSRRSSKSPARQKSPARPKSPSRKRSPARTKSPARKSPARQKIELTPPPLQASTPKIPVPKARTPIRRSPSRKSPTRAAKTITRSADTFFSEKVQRPRRGQLDIDTDSDTPDGDVFGLQDKPHAAVKGRARRLEVQVEKMNIAAAEAAAPTSFNVIKRMTQSSQTRDVERVVHLKHFDTVAQKLGEFSDEDESIHTRKSVSVERTTDFKQITEFGGIGGALFLTVMFPTSIMALFISCNEYQCSFVKLPTYAKYLHFSTYFDLASVLAFLGYAVLLALLSVIPFGGKQISGMATKQGKFTYVMNGLFSCFVLIAIAIALEFKGIPISELIVKHLFHIFIASLLFGFSLTLYAYVRSFYVPFSSLNIHVVGRNKIYGFFMGREHNPRLFGLLDLKMYAFRLALIGAVILDFAFLYRAVAWTSTPITSNGLNIQSLNVHSTLFALVLIHSIYFLDGLAYETSWVTSFEIQYEGFGFMGGVGYLLYPFMMISVTKYVVDYNIQLSFWKLILISLIFFFGYVLYRGSNNQKDAFRKNPYDPALSHLETIPTTKGKKLLCSGFWGVVRHPNYLGDILMNMTFIPFAYNVPPVLSAVCIILLLIHRSVRDHVRCKQKYGAAWDRYCNKVKYVLIPKVY